MSDKSKLGFNINPKNYDELNSTDSLITSGSDSGWLGKKLQGDDSNDLDLSKINPLFDKELYEKYRPGVNANDGSVNQDIWGYKCFNSPVSFRNGIYGDTYSIHSIDTYEGDTLNNTKKNGIIIQPYNKQAGRLNNIDSTFRICNEKRSEQKNDKNLIYVDTRVIHTQRSYTGKENQYNVEDVNLYDILKNTHIDGANTENISYTQSKDFPGGGEYTIAFIQNTFDHCTIYSSNSTHRENAVTYNGINTFSNKKIDKQIGPFPYVTTYNYQDLVNITSSIYGTNNIGTDEEPKHSYNISRITIGTECGNDPVIEKEITANNNCIRMYSADGTHGNDGYTNDSISSIIITPDYISMSAKNNANQSADNTYIKIDGADNSITLHAGKLNLPDTIETTAKFAVKAGALSKEINSANYIYATDNSILPNNDSVISLGSNSYKYSDIYADRLIGTALAAQGITYRNILDGTYTDLLITTSANKIVPYDNRKIDLGSTLAPLQNVYADKFIGTVTKAERDGNNNIITDTYFKLYSNNTITGLNYIKGAGEHIRFTEADTGSARTFTSIATSYADNYHEYCTNLRWSNNEETAFIVCGLNLQISYDPNSDSGEFQILPHVYTDSTSPDISMRMILGSIYEPLSSIYCNEFPTLYKTIAGNQFNTNNSPYYGTSIGNIRLLCIVLPYTGPDLNAKVIYPGYKFTGMFKLGNVTYHARLARFNVNSPNNINNSLNNLIAVLPVDENDVTGTWVALSGADVSNSPRSDEMYVPILAMRVE